MNNFNRIKNKIINEGCYIEAETYKNGVTIHSLIKREDDNTKTIFCEIASNIAMMLEKDTGKAITQKDGLTVALNFNPDSISIIRQRKRQVFVYRY